MHNDRDWADLRPQNASTFTEAGFGMVRITLLFGSFAIAIALFLTPLLDRSEEMSVAGGQFYTGVDRMATGTVRSGERQYTLRRSVLQMSPTSTCVIHSNGARTGDC